MKYFFWIFLWAFFSGVWFVDAVNNDPSWIAAWIGLSQQYHWAFNLIVSLVNALLSAESFVRMKRKEESRKVAA